MYWHVNNLYEWVMSQKLISILNEKKNFYKKLSWKQRQRHIFEVDVEYPKRFHNLHNDLPLLPDRMKNKVSKTYRVQINISWFRKYNPFFSFHDASFPTYSKKSWYQSIMQFLIPKQGNLFSAAFKNNFNMPGVDKSCTCVRYILEIINFTNYRTIF